MWTGIEADGMLMMPLLLLRKQCKLEDVVVIVAVIDITLQKHSNKGNHVKVHEQEVRLPLNDNTCSLPRPMPLYWEVFIEMHVEYGQQTYNVQGR